MAKNALEISIKGNVAAGAQGLWDTFNQSIGKAGVRKLEQFATVNAARALQPDVRDAAPRDQGALAKSIRGRRSRITRPGAIVGPVAGKKGAWYAWFVVRGTRPHDMPKTSATRRAAMFFDGALHQRVKHPGMSPNNFVERAVAANIHKANEAYGGTVVLMLRDAAFRNKVLGLAAQYAGQTAAQWQSKPFGRHWKNADWVEPFHTAIRRPTTSNAEISATGRMRDQYMRQASGVLGVVPRMNRARG